MSQSPEIDDAPADQVRLYKRQWRAFSQLIAEGRSFSGHERNCCFLNLGGGDFANVSASTQLDFLDDARAVSVVDWNFDGRLDFWITNRTTPRIRFLRNDTHNDSHFIALRLFGVHGNRDAIGARAELFLTDSNQTNSSPSPNPLVKQLSAGDGYLSQSSKWIHFGIPAGKEIDRLVVHWPNALDYPKSNRQTFRGLRQDRHYELVQGATDAKLWAPPRTIQSDRPEVVTPPDDPLQRTLIAAKVFLPDADYQDWQGNQVPLTHHVGKPLLVNLWSRTCLPCLNELAEWTQEVTRIRDAKLNIMALSVDALLARNEPPRAQQALKKIGFPWSSGLASPKLMQTLELMHDAHVHSQQELPLPSSFLLDGQGRLAAIYKGPVPVDTLLEDVAELNANIDSRRTSAVPFPGRWGFRPWAADPERIVKKLDAWERTADAISYARRCIADLERSAAKENAAEREKASPGSPHEIQSSRDDDSRILMDLHGVLGELLLKSGLRDSAGIAFARLLELGEHEAVLHRDIGESYMAHNMPMEAVEHLAIAIRSTPNDADLLYHLGIAELATKNLAAGLEHLKRAHELLPNDENICFHLANAMHATGQTRNALGLYQKALQQRPGWPFAANNLAWILATHRDASVRDGREAVRLAESLCQATNYSDVSAMATLAAAYAEVARFRDASRMNDRAIQLAGSQGKTDLAKRLRDRAAMFAARRPVRE